MRNVHQFVCNINSPVACAAALLDVLSLRDLPFDFDERGALGDFILPLPLLSWPELVSNRDETKIVLVVHGKGFANGRHN